MSAVTTILVMVSLFLIYQIVVGQGTPPQVGLRDRRGMGYIQRAEGGDAKGSISVRCENAGREEDAETKQRPETDERPSQDQQNPC